jgi:glyoxylase-like metal-dependent hydrolase (beta-lactamase superfamily II)
MDIQTVTDREFGENSYIIADNGALYVIDPGADYNAVNEAVKRTGLPVKYVLLTHGHYDHTFSVRDFNGVKVFAHSEEKPLLEDASKNLSEFTGKPFSINNINYYSGQKHSIDDIEITHTPGHTAGCVVIKIKDSLFSGDTLFYDTIGRTDLPTGDPVIMRESLRLFDSFDKNLKVYPGHGDPFILGDAYKINFYLKKNSR